MHGEYAFSHKNFDIVDDALTWLSFKSGLDVGERLKRIIDIDCPVETGVKLVISIFGYERYETADL